MHDITPQSGQKAQLSYATVASETNGVNTVFNSINDVYDGGGNNRFTPNLPTSLDEY